MLKVILEYRKGILFVRLIGDLTKETIVTFEKQVLVKMKQGGIYHIVYNFEQLKHLDQAGYHRILYSYELCQKHRGKIFVCNNMKEQISDFLKHRRIAKYVSFLNNELDVFKEVTI